MNFFLQILIVLSVLACVFSEYNQYDTTVTTSSCVCTTVPCPVAGANYLTEGGGAIGTYVYKLNSNNIPIVSSASITITKASLDLGTDTSSCTQTYSRNMDDDGVQDCDAGHILAHRLGGIGTQPINIFPQDLSINRGSYAQYENQIYDCVYNGASSASLSWTFTYSSVSRTKPIGVLYNAKFVGGSCATLSQQFTNGA